MSDHGIKDDQQFAHAGNQGNIRRFARGPQPFVKVSDHGIAPASSQSGHVKSSAHMGSTAPNGAASPQQAATPVQWCHTNKRSNLFAIQVPQLRQLGQHGATNDRPDAGHTLEQIFLLTPDRALTDGLVKIFVGSLQFGLQPTEMCSIGFFQPSAFR